MMRAKVLWALTARLVFRTFEGLSRLLHYGFGERRGLASRRTAGFIFCSCHALSMALLVDRRALAYSGCFVAGGRFSALLMYVLDWALLMRRASSAVLRMEERVTRLRCWHSLQLRLIKAFSTEYSKVQYSKFFGPLHLQAHSNPLICSPHPTPTSAPLTQSSLLSPQFSGTSLAPATYAPVNAAGVSGFPPHAVAFHKACTAGSALPTHHHITTSKMLKSAAHGVCPQVLKVGDLVILELGVGARWQRLCAAGMQAFGAGCWVIGYWVLLL